MRAASSKAKEEQLREAEAKVAEEEEEAAVRVQAGIRGRQARAASSKVLRDGSLFRGGQPQ